MCFIYAGFLNAGGVAGRPASPSGVSNLTRPDPTRGFPDGSAVAVASAPGPRSGRVTSLEDWAWVFSFVYGWCWAYAGAILKTTWQPNTASTGFSFRQLRRSPASGFSSGPPWENQTAFCRHLSRFSVSCQRGLSTILRWSPALSRVSKVLRILNLEESNSYVFDYSDFCRTQTGGRISLILLVGAGRFERPTPCAQGRCATRLRYAPTSYSYDSKLLLEQVQLSLFATVGKAVFQEVAKSHLMSPTC
jgi:hypothetical protein